MDFHFSLFIFLKEIVNLRRKGKRTCCKLETEKTTSYSPLEIGVIEKNFNRNNILFLRKFSFFVENEKKFGFFLFLQKKSLTGVGIL